MRSAASRTPRRYLLEVASAVLLCLCGATPSVLGKATRTNIVCRPELALSHRERLVGKLRLVTGWGDLKFDEAGRLLTGDQPDGGSLTARELFIAAGQNRDLIIIEDASRRDDVVFARVVPGRWREGAAHKPPAHVMLIDFADFEHLQGDKAARDAFDLGWALIHEVAHVVHNFGDTDALHETGECEMFVNQMRREVGVAERVSYFFTLLPGQQRSEFKNRLVRLAFDHHDPATKKKKRFWLIWDANMVGVVKPPQSASGSALIQ